MPLLMHVEVEILSNKAHHGQSQKQAKSPYNYSSSMLESRGMTVKLAIAHICTFLSREIHPNTNHACG